MSLDIIGYLWSVHVDVWYTNNLFLFFSLYPTDLLMLTSPGEFRPPKQSTPIVAMVCLERTCPWYHLSLHSPVTHFVTTVHIPHPSPRHDARNSSTVFYPPTKGRHVARFVFSPGVVAIVTRPLHTVLPSLPSALETVRRSSGDIMSAIGHENSNFLYWSTLLWYWS